MQWNNKNVVITGGAQGIGFVIASTIAEKGATAVIIDFNGDSAAAAATKLEEQGLKGCSYVCDVTDESAVTATFERIIGDLGAIHGLVNNAGIIRDGLTIKIKDGDITKMPLHQWQSVIDTNLTGTFLCGREAAYHMIKGENEGVIINISSLSRSGNLGQCNYSAAKAGVAAMSVTWAKELSRFGIRSCAIAPGFVITPMTSSMPENILDKITSAIPLGRIGKPEEIAQAAVMIFENSYINGRVIEVDGGLRI